MNRARTTLHLCAALAAGLAAMAPAAFGQCPTSFAAPVNYATGGNPWSVAIGDLNGDGWLDLAVVNSYGSNSVSVLLGNGDGTFAAAVNYGTGVVPISVAIGDVSGDGRPDLVTVNWGSANVSVLLGNGDGTFQTKVDYGTGSGPYSVAIGDVSGDGKPDLAVANYVSNSVSVLLGNGDGTFQTKVDYGAGSSPDSVAVADLSGDGRLDLVTANYNSSNVSVLLGNGDGTFQTKVDHAAGSQPRSVAIGDVSGDGKPDLAVANYGSNCVSVLLGNGNGTFAAAANYGASTGPWSVAIGDLNGNGSPELVVANYGSNSVSVLLGNGNGTFGSVVNFGAGTSPQSVAIGDFNLDGRPDLAAANYGSGNVSVLLNNGLSILQQPASQTVSEGQSVSFSVTTIGAVAYQWRRGGVPLSDGGNISGATTATLTINPAVPTDSGFYDVQITAACGANVPSESASLWVISADGAWSQRCMPLQLTLPDGAPGDNFGYSVALSGDTLVVGTPADDAGANADQGSASVYRWTGSGWAFEATLTASDGAAGDHFGNSVSLDGDTAVVGSEYNDEGANEDQGSAYVFVRSGTTWTQQAKLIAADGAAFDYFGSSVALTGDTVVVGAPFDDDPNNMQGSAYVFVRSGTTWTQQAKLIASDGEAGNIMGDYVAISGDTVLAGGHFTNVGSNTRQGAVWVFVRSGATWTQQARLTAADGAAFDYLGPCAISGDLAVLGAPGDDSTSGSAYVFSRSGSVWTQEAKLTASDRAADDWFGNVAILGDTIVVGAASDDVSANANQGSVYLFNKPAGGWQDMTETGRITAPDGGADDYFGWRVALFADTLVVTAFGDEVGANSDQGSAWVFSRVGSTWIGPDAKLIADDGAVSDTLGTAVAISGDTAVMGARNDDVGANTDQGSAYVFVRSGTAWTQQAKLIASDGAASDWFGTSIALFGDTAVVGAFRDDSGRGSAYVFVRSGTTWTQQDKLIAADGAANDGFGNSVALDGDTAILGAFGDDSSRGSAYVFVRSGTTWTQQAKLTALDGVGGDDFGYSVAVSGDRAIVTAAWDDVGANSNQGSAYVFVRSGTTWTQQAQITASDGAVNHWFGASVALSSDTAVVGAVGNANGQGSAYVFVRSGTMWMQQAKLTASDGAAPDDMGRSVAISGNTAVAGAQQDDVGANWDQGSAYVFVRSGTIWTQQTKLTAADGAVSDFFGWSVALSGDTAVVGAVYHDVGVNGNQGSAYIFDIPAECFSLAHNDTLDVAYPTLAAALLPAQSGQQITASPAAFAGIGTLDTFGRSLGIFSSGQIRTPSASIITLGGSSSLAAAAGETAEIFGQLRASGYTDIYGNEFLLGSRGILTARTGSSLIINAPAACLEGQTRLEQGASLTFAGTAENIGPLTASSGFSIFAGGVLTNIDTWSLTAGQIAAPLYYNRAATDIFGSTAIFGDFTNEAGAVTTIRSGTLYVFGTLTNNGTIIGTVVGDMLDGGEADVGAPPNLDVTGSLILGPAANLTMPFADAMVHVGGHFDCAINSNTRFDLSLATLQTEGTGAEQTLEVMSRDIGADARGLDRSIAGQFPIRVLHFGAAPSTVRLVDGHDNDGFGQGVSEALYVDELRIDAGSHLINTTGRIYYRTLVNSGTVDVPANLVAIRAGDIDGDGDVDAVDIGLFVGVLIGTEVNADYQWRSDLDHNGQADGRDIQPFVDALLAGH